MYRFVPNVRWITGRHLPSECLVLQSQPIGATTSVAVTAANHSIVQVNNMIIPSLNADIIAMLVKGQMYFYHITSGVKVFVTRYLYIYNSSYSTKLTNYIYTYIYIKSKLQ